MIVLLFVIKPISKTVDALVYNGFSLIQGEKNPDSSIIIIHINSNDLEQIGPWPIKRSYYALLINNLKKLKVSKIGLEVFLSSKFASQAVYDNLLQAEIVNAGNVILSSIAGEIIKSNNYYITDSLSLSSPKLINESLQVGHINFIKDYGIKIPLRIKHLNTIEESFSLKLSGLKDLSRNHIKLNFHSSWKKFKNYSMLEFFELVQADDSKLSEFENKIVIIGISDPQISPAFSSTFDEELPGIALHAFALDNLLSNRFISESFYFISAVIFLIIILVLLILAEVKQFNRNYYFLLFVSLFTITFFIYLLFYVELSVSFFIIPLFLVLTIEFLYEIDKRKKSLKGALDETKVLKNLLKVKQNNLEALQTELNLSSEADSSNILEKIKSLMNDIAKLKDVEEDDTPIKTSLESNEENFFGLIYRSNIIKGIVDLIRKASPGDTTILISGESGTGKELVAKAIHALSNRRDEKFIAVNCGALSETLLESELFGHTKGSFTGAIADKIGKFEAADNGTIFLDEIGEISENFQVKLLRVLQSGEVDKVGATSTSKVNVRVIAATNKDLKQQVSEKKFREDLYYRINVFNIHLAPLRERKDDIEPITKHILNKTDSSLQISVASLSALVDFDWRGNVRELESVIKRAIVFCTSAGRKMIQLADLPDELVKNIKLNFEDIVIQSLREKQFSHSSINETAQELGNVNRTLISENFRGYSLKVLVENNFNENETVSRIADSNDQDSEKRVSGKLNIWLKNIKKDVESTKSDEFEEIKNKLSSKYKNLPQKFHSYLDEVIKHYLNKKY